MGGLNKTIFLFLTFCLHLCWKMSWYISPCVLNIINTRLVSGWVSVYFKNAAIHPFFKKTQALASYFQPETQILLGLCELGPPTLNCQTETCDAKRSPCALLWFYGGLLVNHRSCCWSHMCSVMLSVCKHCSTSCFNQLLLVIQTHV